MKRTAPKNSALEASLPEGHLALFQVSPRDMKRLTPQDAASFAKLRGLIEHLMRSHNALLDSSASFEVKQAAALLEFAIDAKIESANVFFERIERAKPKRVKRAKVSQTKLAKKMRKMRATETPKQKRARLDKRNALLAAWKKRSLKSRRADAKPLKRAKPRSKAA
jgi:hypothetical protein